MIVNVVHGTTAVRLAPVHPPVAPSDAEMTRFVELKVDMTVAAGLRISLEAQPDEFFRS
jgi:hypothetical protein